MSTPRGTLGGWRPTTPIGFARPVQDEDATRGLCGCELPDGRGLLTWPSGSDVHAAITDAPSDWIIDDVVPLADIFTACTPGATVRRSACFEYGGEVYLSVLMAPSSGTATLTIWQADDPANPDSGFSLLSTVWSASYTTFGTTWSTWVGIPHVTGSTWVLPGHDVGDLGGISTNRTVGVWSSSDGMATWSRSLTFAFSGFGPPLDYGATQLASDPDGYMHMFAARELAFEPYTLAMWRSSDGTSWSMVDTDPTILDAEYSLATFVNNGSTLYMAGNADVFELTGAGTDVDDFTDTGREWGSAGGQEDVNTRKLVITAAGVYGFALDKVWFSPLPVWSVGFVGWTG